ncbi:Flp family type IVb pilin [Nocardioides sp. LML1-1-1.1]|uniref:Flp family type IVb pilin n=1 Tax=Nocardioides sp. LML1-1-1.1 TaxID=3135248 RepID=UPI00341FB088
MDIVTMEQRGATAVEYALLVTLIAIAIVGSVLAFGTGLADLFAIDLSPGG